MGRAARAALAIERLAACATGFMLGLSSWTRLPGPWGGRPVSWDSAFWPLAVWLAAFVAARLGLDEDEVVSLDARVKRGEGLIFAAGFLAACLFAAAGFRV